MRSRRTATPFTAAGCPILFAHFPVMGIIAALYERGRCRSQQEIPRGRRPWNPHSSKNERLGHPARRVSALTLEVLHVPLMSCCGFAGSECPKIAALPRFWIFLA